MLTMLSGLLFASASFSATDTLTIGQLNFTPCELTRPSTSETTAALCAPFKAPENWKAPEGRQIDLKLALIRAESATPKPDLVVFLAGGPGQAATEAYPVMAGALAQLHRKHHILLVDQRGTGGSHALKCQDEALSPTSESNTNQWTTEMVTHCLSKLDADPRYYTTTDAVRDLEAVRIQLGNPRFNLVGVSYGTRVAQAYLRAYAAGVRSMILDGVVPNELILGSDFSKNLEDSLKLYFSQCSKNSICSNHFHDPYQTLYDLRNKLRNTSQTITFNDPQTFKPISYTLNEDTLITLARLFAYTPETAALLPLSLDQALHGNYAPLLGQAHLIAHDFDTTITDGMGLSVICAEDADLLHPQAGQENTLLGNKLISTIQAQCKVWPHGSRPADFHQSIQSNKPILLLSGEYDPVTPPHYAEQVLKGLSNGRHLIAKGQAHNVMPRGCMPRLAAKFVDELNPQNLDASCLEELGPIPAFIDFNGAAP